MLVILQLIGQLLDILSNIYYLMSNVNLLIVEYYQSESKTIKWCKLANTRFTTTFTTLDINILMVTVMKGNTANVTTSLHKHPPTVIIMHTCIRKSTLHTCLINSNQIILIYHLYSNILWTSSINTWTCLQITNLAVTTSVDGEFTVLHPPSNQSAS